MKKPACIRAVLPLAVGTRRFKTSDFFKARKPSTRISEQP